MRLVLAHVVGRARLNLDEGRGYGLRRFGRRDCDDDRDRQHGAENRDAYLQRFALCVKRDFTHSTENRNEIASYDRRWPVRSVNLAKANPG